MEDESVRPEEQAAEAEVTETPAAEAAPAGTPGRAKAIAVAALIVALPAAYLLLHHPASSMVQASAPQATPASGVNLAALEGAVRNDPSVENKVNLSLGYIQAGQAGRAIPLLEAVTAADPKNSLAWNNLCVANTLQQNYKEGMDDCGRALAAKPDFPLAKNNLKWATDERDKTVKSLAEMEETDPAKRDAKFYLGEGFAFLHIGNYPEAVHAWQRMLEVDPKSAVAANNIGLAMMMERQPAGAIPWFQRAVALDPTMQVAKNNLAWAESVKNGK
jgi:tetratricopeptide (TPR) repeat protein